MTNEKLHTQTHDLVCRYGVVAIIKSLIIDIATRHLKWADRADDDLLSRRVAADFLHQRKLLEAYLQILKEKR